MRLMARLRDAGYADLTPAALFDARTVRALAEVVRGARSISEGPAVCIQPGVGRPLFLVHPVGGMVLCYRELASLLGRPVYGLNAQEAGPALAIEEMAADYLRAVRRIQPRGPYLFGGWSLGGVIALEMAQQARSALDEVELVAMLDSWAPHTIRDEPLSASSEIERRLIAALRGYEPRPYAGRAVLLAAASTSAQFADGPAPGWRPIIERLEVETTAGDHDSLVAHPFVEELASRLRRALDGCPVVGR
jgi:thioesterase domain-containing protein